MARVLVIDDDAFVRSMVSDVLEVGGHSVATAEDGIRGLEMVAADRPDVVLLDVMMPGLDGFAVLAQLRAVDEEVHLPVVMLTACADDASQWQSWTGGIDYFLAKPFDPDELLRYLDYLFAGSGTALELG